MRWPWEHFQDAATDAILGALPVTMPGRATPTVSPLPGAGTAARQESAWPGQEEEISTLEPPGVEGDLVESLAADGRHGVASDAAATCADLVIVDELLSSD